MRNTLRTGDRVVVVRTARYSTPPRGARTIVPESRGEGYLCTVERRGVVLEPTPHALVIRDESGVLIRVNPADTSVRREMFPWVGDVQRRASGLLLRAFRDRRWASPLHDHHAGQALSRRP